MVIIFNSLFYEKWQKLLTIGVNMVTILPKMKILKKNLFENTDIDNFYLQTKFGVNTTTQPDTTRHNEKICKGYRDLPWKTTLRDYGINVSYGVPYSTPQ